MADIMDMEEINRIRKEMYSEAGKQTVDTLADFVRKCISSKYVDDSAPIETSYEIAPRIVAACALAGGWAAVHALSITGFQAGFVMWDFIREWMFSSNKTGLRIIDYDNMLYPQYEYKFQKTIDSETWEALQAEAKRNLAENTSAHPNVRAHWESIARGEIPFGYRIRED